MQTIAQKYLNIEWTNENPRKNLQRQILLNHKEILLGQASGGMDTLCED